MPFYGILERVSILWIQATRDQKRKEYLLVQRYHIFTPLHFTYISHFQSAHCNQSHISERSQRLLHNHTATTADDPYLVLWIIAQSLEHAGHGVVGRSMKNTSEIVLEVTVEAFFGLESTTVVENEETGVGVLVDFFDPVVLENEYVNM